MGDKIRDSEAKAPQSLYRSTCVKEEGKQMKNETCGKDTLVRRGLPRGKRVLALEGGPILVCTCTLYISKVDYLLRCRQQAAQ